MGRSFRGPSSWGGSSTGGGGAPADGPYVTTAADGDLPNETLIGSIILPPDVFANRPAATGLVAGTVFFSTDTATIYRADGAGNWVVSGTYVALSDYEDADVLAKVKNVDGTGSGLDADLLDGQHASAFALDSAVVHDTGNETVDGVKTFSSAPVAAGLDVGSSAPVTVDTVAWSQVIRPAAGQGGLAIKIPASTYDDGDPSPYASGEFLFAILEEGAGDATDSTSAGSVLFRLARTGVGAAGLHLAPGFRTAYPAASNCLHIQPYQTDVIPLLIQASSADGTGATALTVNAAGQTLHQVGSVGTPSISFVGDTDTGLYATADAIGFVTGGAQRMALTSTLFVINDGMNFNIGTTNGTKFGTATTQKIGFYNATPVAKQTGVAVTAAGIHAALVTLGLIAA